MTFIASKLPDFCLWRAANLIWKTDMVFIFIFSKINLSSDTIEVTIAEHLPFPLRIIFDNFLPYC